MKKRIAKKKKSRFDKALDKELAKRLQEINKVVCKRLEMVNKFNDKLSQFLDENKVVVFLRLNKTEYVVKIVDNIVGFKKLECFKTNCDTTPQKALIHMTDVSDDDYITEMSREFVHNSNISDELKDEILASL